MNKLDFTKSIDFFELGDFRLNKRLVTLFHQTGQSYCLSTPQSINNRGQTKAYYRFINNKRVKYTELISGYSTYSRQNISDSAVILAVQDTTTLNYSTKRSAPVLDCLASPTDKGFMLHNHLLMNGLGCPLGLFSQLMYNRKAETLGKGKTNLRKQTPFCDKESYRWLSQFEALQDAYSGDATKLVIQICDREGDIHELLQARKYDHIHYIIRSSYERSSADNDANIWEQVANEPYAYTYELSVDSSNERTKRKATMEVRYKEVQIKASYRKDKSLVPQTLWLLETREVNPPQDEAPIHWRLLTSLPITDADIAGQIIQYYVLRWVIERFHYVLKQGVLVQDLQIETKEALQNAIILKSWAALEVLTLAYMPKTNEQITLKQAGFCQKDYDIAYQFAKKRCNTKETKKEEPLLSDFTRLIAQIGGHSLQKNKTIGVNSIWKGWTTFSTIKDAIALFDKDVGNQ
jgi:Transposase DNA-binding/Transposase DDE domain